MKRLLGRLAVPLIALSLLTMQACSSSSDESAGDGAAPGSDGPTLKVGFVADVAGLNDDSFNYLGDLGMKRAESELGVETRVLTSKSNADYIPNMATLARQGYDLIIASGFNEIEAVATVSKQFPDTKFAILDVSVDFVEGAGDNVTGLPFQQDQASFMAGYLGALFAVDKFGDDVALGAIGGEPIPPVENWLDGFSAGVKAADPNLRVIQGYSQSFGDPAPCKLLAENQIGQGASVLFQVAGGCGIGVINAAKDAGVYVIGSDADQSSFGDHVLTSAMKKSDVAVFDTIKDLQDGTFRGGEDRLFNIEDGAVGLGTISPEVSDEIKQKVEAMEEKLKSGEVEVGSGG